MPKLPPISGKKAIKVFEKNGYRVVRKRGSHFRLKHPQKDPLSIPDHKTISKGLLRRLLRDSKLSIEEFVKLLKEK